MSTDPKAFLKGLGPRDLVLVGDTLWEPATGAWLVGGEQRLFQALSGLARSRGLRVVGVQPHPDWAAWEGEGIQWIGVPPGRRSGWRRWLWNRQLHCHLSPQARVVYSYAELAHPRRVPGALIWQHGVAWDGRAAPSGSGGPSARTARSSGTAPRSSAWIRTTPT